MARSVPARAMVLPAASLVGMVFLVSWQKTTTLDLYFHLAIGREIVARHSTLPMDVFSYSVPGAPWRYKDVLADVLLYLGYDHLGFPFFFGLKLLAALGIGGALLLASRSSSVPGGRSAPWLLSLGLLFAAVQYRIVERPLLLSLALFPLLLALLERARRGLGRTSHLALFAPPVLLQWGWIQLHREALIGLVFLGGLCCYLALAILLPRLCRVQANGRAAFAAFLALLAAAALDLVNPCGTATVTSTLGVSGSQLYRQVIMDWRALGPAELLGEFPAAMGLALGALVGIAVRLGPSLRRRPSGAQPVVPDGGIDLWHLGCWIVLAGKTLESSRYVPFLASQSAIVVLLLLQDGMEWLARRGHRPRGLVLLAGVLALCVVAVTLPAVTTRGLGPLPEHYPEAALRFARAHRLHERVVNSLGLGGYVMWQGHEPGMPPLSVLVDGRVDMVYPARHLRDCLRAERRPDAFAAMRQHDGADWVLAENEVGQESHPFLSRDPAWGLVFWSEPAAIFVRKDAYPELAASIFRHFDRADVFGSVMRAAALARRDPAQLPQIEAEMRRLLEASPQGALSHMLLILFYHRLGGSQDRERERLIGELRRQNPDHPVLEQLPRMLSRR